MARRTDFKKAITYTGQKIKGWVTFSYKIDGVRMLYRNGRYVTRNDKTPVGFHKALSEDAKREIRLANDVEIYTGDFHQVQGGLSQLEPEQFINRDNIYSLATLDRRLIIDTVENPSESLVEQRLEEALALGYEGLVLRSEERWYRVKPKHTADVRITGYFEQHDKHGNPKGILGGWTTNYGNVTAMKDEVRVAFWREPESYIGDLIEVEYKELYKTGKFRYAVKFLRFRLDKEEESFDT